MSSITNPRQTVLITSREEMTILGKEQAKDNVFTIDWHMPTSFKPLLYAISVGKSRFTCEMIKKSKVFVVNFIPLSLKKEALFCGRHSGEHIDKFRETGLTKEEADSIDCPRIKEAAAYLECEVINEIETGDHVIFIGKAVNSGHKRDEKRLFHLTKDGFTTTVDKG